MSEEVIEMNAAGIDLTDLGDDPAQDNIADYDPAEEGMPEEEPEFDDPDRRKIIIAWFIRAKNMHIASRHLTDVDVGSLSSMPFGELEQLHESKKEMIRVAGNVLETGFQMAPLALETVATNLEAEGEKHLARGYADALTKDYGFNQSMEVVELDLIDRGVSGPKLPAPVMALGHAAKVYFVNRLKNKSTVAVASVQVPTDLNGAIGRL